VLEQHQSEHHTAQRKRKQALPGPGVKQRPEDQCQRDLEFLPDVGIVPNLFKRQMPQQQLRFLWSEVLDYLGRRSDGMIQDQRGRAKILDLHKCHEEASAEPATQQKRRDAAGVHCASLIN